MPDCTDCCTNDLPFDRSPDPFARLAREHSAALLQLRVLDEAAHALRTTFDEGAYLRLNMAITFIDSEIRGHNEREEKFLFPVIESRIQGPVAVMIHEHRLLYSAYDRLREAATARRDHDNGEELVRRALEVVELLSEHIAKENDILFPMARNVLSEQEMNTFATAMVE